jgi:hypothetical protein
MINSSHHLAWLPITLPEGLILLAFIEALECADHF